MLESEDNDNNDLRRRNQTNTMNDRSMMDEYEEDDFGIYTTFCIQSDLLLIVYIYICQL